MKVKRRIVKITDLAQEIGCLFLPKLRFRWKFSCGHVELRSHRTISGNGGEIVGGKLINFGFCKQCSC